MSVVQVVAWGGTTKEYEVEVDSPTLTRPSLRWLAQRRTHNVAQETVFAAALAAAVATPALAQMLVGEAWTLRENMAYAVNPAGKMQTLPIGGHGMRMLMRRARPVPRGTVLFMHDGQLYMTRGGGVFDRAGNWMGGGN
jgi:hypothetical protein